LIGFQINCRSPGVAGGCEKERLRIFLRVDRRLFKVTWANGRRHLFSGGHFCPSLSKLANRHSGWLGGTVRRTKRCLSGGRNLIFGSDVQNETTDEQASHEC
jgi:hypothetical protein